MTGMWKQVTAVEVAVGDVIWTSAEGWQEVVGRDPRRLAVCLYLANGVASNRVNSDVTLIRTGLDSGRIPPVSEVASPALSPSPLAVGDDA